MRSAQTPTLRPFVGKPVAFTPIAAWASDHNIFYPIRSAAIKRYDMINMIYLTQLAVAVVTLSLLSLVLLLYFSDSRVAGRSIFTRSITSCMFTVLLRMTLLIFFTALKKTIPMALAAPLDAFTMFFRIALTKAASVLPIFFRMIPFVFIAASSFANSTTATQTRLFRFIRRKTFRCCGEFIAAFGAALERGYTWLRHGANLAVSRPPGCLQHRRGFVCPIPFYYTARSAI